MNEFVPAAAGASLLPVIAPELKVLLDYWLSLRAEGPVPDRGLFDPAVVKQLLARFWVIRRDPSTGRYRFTLAGEQIRELLGRKVTGVYIEELFPGNEEVMNNALDEVTQTPAIHHTAGPMYRVGMNPLISERLALPMADNGVIDTVYGATLYQYPTRLPSRPAEFVSHASPSIVPVKNLPAAR